MEALQISITVFSFIGFVWRVKDAEAKIYKAIDSIDKRLDLHIQESQSSRAEIFYRLDGLGQRMGNEIENLKKGASGTIVFERLEEKIDNLIKKIP